MCHPYLPLEGISEKAKQRRWVALQLQQMQLMVAEAMDNIQAARRRDEANGGGGGGGGVGTAAKVVQCVCSPTRHPGSFRCRYHQGEYQWTGSRMRPSNHTGNGH